MKKQDHEFVEWARAATKGVTESASFMQLFAEYALQLGAAILQNKPLVILAPEGADVPSKLRAAADSVQFYVRDDKQSIELAARRGLEAIGVVRH
jgi:hypothetical protein